MAKLVRKKRWKRGKLRDYWAVRTRRGSEYGAGYDKAVAERLRDHYTGLEILEANGVPLPSVSDWTFEDLREYDLAAHAREGGETDSRRRRWDVLERFFGQEKEIDRIDREAIGAFIAARQEAGAGPATIRRDLSVLKTALARARQPEALSGYEQDPFAGIPSTGRKERRARAKTPKFRPELVEAVIAAAWEVAGEQPPYVRPREWRQNAEILELIYRTKSRVEQVCELRRDQVRPHPNRGGRVLWFPPDKNGDERFFEYRGRIRAILDAIPDDGSGLFFPSQRGGDHRESPRRRFLQRAIARARERIDAPELAGLTLRSLRKSKACADLARGKKPVEVQAELGHKSLATTMDWYAEVFPHVGSVDRLPPKLPTAPSRKGPSAARSSPAGSADSRGNAKIRGRAAAS